MSYDIFFVRRDPGQSFGDALDGVEESFEGGDPGPLSEEELELWGTLLPQAREVLGPQVEVTQEDDETRELSDPLTGIELTFFQGELQIHVPASAAGGQDPDLMQTVYEFARTVEEVTGLEGYDPQLGEPISDTSDTSPTRREWTEDDEWSGDDRDDEVEAMARTLVGASAGQRRRWWEIWRP